MSGFRFPPQWLIRTVESQGLLEYKPNAMQTGPKGLTALTFACQKGFFEVCTPCYVSAFCSIIFF